MQGVNRFRLRRAEVELAEDAAVEANLAAEDREPAVGIADLHGRIALVGRPRRHVVHAGLDHLLVATEEVGVMKQRAGVLVVDVVVAADAVLETHANRTRVGLDADRLADGAGRAEEEHAVLAVIVLAGIAVAVTERADVPIDVEASVRDLRQVEM